MPEMIDFAGTLRSKLPRPMRLGVLATLVLAGSVASSVPARADFTTTVTQITTPVSGNLFRYDYTLTNDPSSTLPITDFFIDVSPDADLQSLSAPAGFIISYSPGDLDVSFSSPDPSSDILPGASGLFSFTSVIGPALAPFLVRGADGAVIEENTGMTISPRAVPEPSSLLLGAIGAGFFGFRLHRRRANA